MTDCDILVVGGGINGVGIARDAVGRGLRVVLCEQDDLASHTSSWSSKLIHGGLRYLEHREFRLVREALIEREVLLRAAPHIIGPLEFCLPHSPEQRPVWLIRLGLFLYDHLAGRQRLAASHKVALAGTAYGAPLKPWVHTAFTYSDCWVDDSRLVVVNAIDAGERGATILTRTRCTRARREDGVWRAELTDARTGEVRSVTARALVNAAGPWVSRFLAEGLGHNSPSRVRLIKGSHLVVPRLHDGAHAYILQNDDKRIVFVIPYEGRFSLIGTTDVAYDGDPREVRISDAEAQYLCRVVNRYFRTSVAPEDAVWTFAGVRPLYDDAAADPSAVTRDYVFDLDAPAGAAPLLSVFGGKITTYRKLAEHALQKLQPVLGVRAADWTERAVLPGGDLPEGDRGAYLAALRRARPWLPEPLAARWVRTYGSLTPQLLGEAQSLADLGADLGGGLHEAELRYLRDNEWARDATDVLWRRTKLGLHVGGEVAQKVDEWLSRKPEPALALP